MSKMKIAIIGASVAFAAAVQSKMKEGVEIVACDDDDVLRSKKLVEGMQFAKPDFLPKWQASKHGKEGRNKSDRKRNRKNRWN